MEINNTKNWCIALNEKAKDVQQYENLLYRFFKSIGQPMTYDNSLMTGCYKRVTTTQMVFKFIFSHLILKTIISALVALFFWISYAINSAGETFMEKMKDAASHLGTRALLPFVIMLIVCTGIHVLFGMLGYKSNVKALEGLEKQLVPLMGTLPANFRNSDKMRAIAKIYFTKPTIDPSIILDCAEDLLHQMDVTAKFMSVMFDLPCECPYLGISDRENANVANTIVLDESGNVQKRSEYLPTDIDDKVMSGSEDADKDLQAMIGLVEVKDQIERLKTRMSFYKTNTNNGNHMAFLGSAGTGKTTVARIVTKIMFDLGYIKKNQYIEISGDYLCAGDTNRAMAIIEYSYGGVLFIDEAYLMEKRGFEVIGVLLKAMEDHRQDFICILAGYEEQMTRLFATNEGFTSRVKHTIYFSDYDENEMLDIFNYFIKNYNGSSYTLDANAVPALLEAFKLEKKAKSFGNARTVRNAVDMIMDFYADRSIKEKTDTKVIMLPDVEAYHENRRKALQHEIKNASAANQIDEQIIRLSELKPRVKLGAEDPDEEFSKLIGLESFVDEINSLKNQKEFYGNTETQRILLVGRNGCGKTTLTRILTGYLYKLGYIDENKYLEIPAEFLKGSFVGHTAKRAASIISYASGGVLFIKNYSLLVNTQDAFAGEAVSAIMTAINENPNVTIVIADEPSETIDSIRNMFTLVYDFPEYTDEQIVEIFVSIANRDGFSLDDGVTEKLAEYIKNNRIKSIRDVQQIYQSTVKTHIAKFDGNEENKYFIRPDELTFTKKLKLNIKR